jgi:hypothetical protein
MGLMMPHEEVYRQEHVSQNYTPKIEKFFAALFTFPYPEFLLRIKGFYGKKVEYSLVVSDFKSSFNNQTGNFDATVKFIGRMYGMYTDIPMAYLLIAPYCTYGAIKNKTVWEQLDFKFPGTNTPIPKLLDLKKLLVDGVEKTKEVIAKSIDANLENVYQKNNSLINIINKFNNFKNYLVMTPKAGLNGNNIVIDSNIFLFKDIYEANGDGRYPYYYLYQENNTKLKDITEELYNSIATFNENYKAKLSYIGGLPKETKIGVKEEYLAVVTHNEDDTITIIFNNEDVKFDLDKFTTLKDKLKLAIPVNTTEQFYVVNAIKFNTDIKTLQDNINQIIKTEEEKKSQDTNITIENILGFKPSVKNMFVILMAHLQTFMEIFNTCVSDINENNKRNIKTLGLTLSNLPDMPSYITQDTHLPPFPAFKKTTNNELCYPNEAGLKGTLEEMSLIETMFVGCNALLKDVTKTEIVTENVKDKVREKLFIPTCITDYNCNLNSDSYSKMDNPYYPLSRPIDDKMHWIWFYFAMRCAQKFMLEQGNDLKADNFGAYEAYNLWLAIPEMDEMTLNALNSPDNGFSKFMEFLTEGEKKCYQLWSGHSLLGAQGDSIYVKQYTNNKKQPTMPHFPARIGHHTSQFYQQFKNDAYDESAFFAFKYGSENFTCEKVGTNWGDITVNQGHRPYGLMQEIPFENLKSWDDSIKNYSNVPNNYTDHTQLVNKQIERSEGYYYSHKTNNIGADKTSNTNPAWNIMCQKGTGGEFFQYIEDPMPEKYNTSLCTVDELLTSSEKLHLHNIRRVDEDAKQCPLFLVEPDNLTTENFLCTIPHNLERIINDLCAGKKIVHIPYATKLFIGFLIDNFQSLTESEIKGFINNVVQKCGADNYGVFNRTPNYKIEGVLDNERSGSFAQMLLLIASFFSLNDKRNIITPAADIAYKNGHINYPITSLIPSNLTITPTLISENIIAMKKAGFFDNDAFGFVKEYRRWSIDEEQGGFKWFVKTMCLNMNENVDTTLVTGKNKTQKFTYKRKIGDTLLTSLKEFINKTAVHNNLTYLQEIFPKEPKKACSNANNSINLLFKEENGKSFSKIYRGIYCQGDKGDVENIYLRFNDEYIGVKELEIFLSKVVYFIVPYPLCTDPSKQTPTTSRSNFQNAFESFISSLKTLYKIEDGSNISKKDETQKSNEASYSGHISITDERKFSMYKTLKNLYDKHLNNINSEIDKFKIISNNKAIQTEMERFHFIDTYYRDISDDLFINPDTMISIIDNITHGYQTGTGEGILNSEMSLYSFMGLLCQRHNMMLMSVPVFNGTHSEFNSDNLEKMFTPIPYSDANGRNSLSGPSYICFYPHQTSQHLNIPISQYKDDGFVIDDGDDVNNTSNIEGASSILEVMQSGDYTIPAFGVEYGSQKQSIFKNINVNMDNPQTTEVSVSTMFAIANNGEGGNKRLVGTGQDLYQIYTNYSYTCQVEMMGCAQIQPLMYFQLNNVPMFRGAYQIIHVEHDIVPGNMTTSFKGVRINKNVMPMAQNFVTINLDDVMGKGSTSASDTIVAENYTYHSLEKNRVHSQDMINHNKSTVSADTLLDDPILKKHICFTENVSGGLTTMKKLFNQLCPTMRQLIYCIVKDLPALSKKLGYTIGIRISSASRYWQSTDSSSYHTTKINKHSRSYGIRSLYSGTKISDDGTGYVEDIPYTQMACAVDMKGVLMNTTPGQDGIYRCNIDAGDKNGASITLFNHIIDYYYMYIKELIWEIHGEDKRMLTNIDILHLASLGECSNTNTGSILMASVTTQNGKTTTTPLRGKPETFVTEFNKACTLANSKKHNGLYTTSYRLK